MPYCMYPLSFVVLCLRLFLVEKEKVKKEKDQELQELNELQYKRVDIILSELVKQFPVRVVTDKVVNQ